VLYWISNSNYEAGSQVHAKIECYH
jgi:hypothetical protein